MTKRTFKFEIKWIWQRANNVRSTKNITKCTVSMPTKKWRKRHDLFKLWHLSHANVCFLVSVFRRNEKWIFSLYIWKVIALLQLKINGLKIQWLEWLWKYFFPQTSTQSQCSMKQQVTTWTPKSMNVTRHSYSNLLVVKKICVYQLDKFFIFRHKIFQNRWEPPSIMSQTKEMFVQYSIPLGLNLASRSIASK